MRTSMLAFLDSDPVAAAAARSYYPFPLAVPKRRYDIAEIFGNRPRQSCISGRHFPQLKRLWDGRPGHVACWAIREQDVDDAFAVQNRRWIIRCSAVLAL